MNWPTELAAKESSNWAQSQDSPAGQSDRGMFWVPAEITRSMAWQDATQPVPAGRLGEEISAWVDLSLITTRKAA